MNMPRVSLRQREPRFENRDLLDLCHMAPCFLRLEGCQTGKDPCVPCHPTHLTSGRGFAMKSHDNLAVPGCPWCHRIFDEDMKTAEAFDIWIRAFTEWDVFRWVNGMVRVA